jgi:hypothetical protein
VDGPETARPPRRASGEADSPFVPLAATAGGLDRARCSSSPRCGLTIAPRASWLPIERSARCTARNSVPVGLFASALPTETSCMLPTRDAMPSAFTRRWMERTP